MATQKIILDYTPDVTGQSEFSAQSSALATALATADTPKTSSGNIGGNAPKATVVGFTPNANGTYTWHYSDGTTTIGGNVNPDTGQALDSSSATPATGTQASVATTSTQASRQNASDAALNQLTNWGVITGPTDPNGEALMSTINGLALQGAGADSISLAIQQSDAYKQRFIGNAARVAAGLPALSPADYIATEQAYDQVLRAAGVPAQFYSTAADKAKLIGSDISPTELQQRADLAKQSIVNADPYYTSQLQTLYGLSQGDMIAHVLDPSAALPLLQQQVSSSQIAAEAAREGVATNLATAQQLAGQGVTQAQAQQGFQSIANQLPATQTLAGRYAGYLNPNEVSGALTSATFGAPGQQSVAQAEAELQRLKTQEISAFSGSSGVGKGSLLATDEGQS